MALFRRHPLRATNVRMPLSASARAEYEDLAGRFDDLEQYLIPAYVRMSRQAQDNQRSHRLLSTLLMMGALAAGVLGAIQAALADDPLPGILLAIVAGVTAALSQYQQYLDPMHEYLRARARTEELRSLYFRYLGGLDGGDERTLEKTVARIEFTKESDDAAG